MAPPPFSLSSGLEKARSRSRYGRALPRPVGWCCKELAMLNWAFAFLIVALLAALLGFTGIVGPASWIAELICVLFLALFLASVISDRRKRGAEKHYWSKELK